MPLRTLTPQAAQELIAQGALLIDIRGADEHARERIASAKNVPMEQLTRAGLPPGEHPAVIYHCHSGQRTRMNAGPLAQCARCEAYVLEGGLDAWKKAGLPVLADASQPLPLQRQVQIAAGALIVLGAVLGAAVSPWFHLLSGMVGAGLVFAGASGFCGMARLLKRMPWNRHAFAG